MSEHSYQTPILMTDGEDPHGRAYEYDRGDTADQEYHKGCTEFIEKYHGIKEQYLTAPDGLLSFFKKHSDNLKGIINTCIERMFDATNSRCGQAQENIDPGANCYEISKDRETHNFWMNNYVISY
jgi:hypothetical protein